MPSVIAVLPGKLQRQPALVIPDRGANKRVQHIRVPTQVGVELRVRAVCPKFDSPLGLGSLSAFAHCFLIAPKSPASLHVGNQVRLSRSRRGLGRGGAAIEWMKPGLTAR